MWYVYIIESQVKDWKYVGITDELKSRLQKHNRGEVQSTKHYRPIILAAYVAVRDKERAAALEKYFKTGSGRAILEKRILGSV